MACRPFDPALYLVTDDARGADRPIEETVRLAIEGGVTLVQLREKRASTRDFVERGRALREVTRRAGVPLIVNDRLDVALAVEADGLHVGRDDLPPAIARRWLGPRRILGVTVADPEAARRAEGDGADYLGCSAVFATPTKTDTGAPLGLAGVRQLVEVVDLPVVAIGGVNAANAREVLGTGVVGLAVVSAIVGAADPRGAAAELAAIVRRWRVQRPRSERGRKR